LNPERNFFKIYHVLIVSLLLAGEARAVDWPEFQGGLAQGIAPAGTELPLEWSTKKNVAWKQPIPGEGWSSPILWKGRLYLTAAVAKGNDIKADRDLHALCIDESTGRILWNRQVFAQKGSAAPRIHKKNSHASPTPVVAPDEKLYVHFGHQGTACLDLSGRILWTNRSLTYPPVHGNGCSPMVVGDKLFFSCDGAKKPFVIALNRHTGKVAWRKDRNADAKKKFAFCTALLIEVDGRQQIISPGGDVVVAYDPASGDEIWRVRYDGYSVVPRPVYGHGLVFFSSGFDRPTFYAVKPTGRGDVTDTHIAWSITKGAPHTPSPLLVGNELYLFSDGGIGSCLDARTGEAHWRERVCGSCSASPFFAAGRIHIIDETGKGVVIEAAKTYRKLAENNINERTLASCAVGENAFYLRSANHLYKIQQR
jgi:outer membrane protein assembly factor BamB